jgi:tetratricopeptide (TPR) repeat protein
VAREADPDPARDRLRQPELWQDGAALARVAREVGPAELPPRLATALGRALRQSGVDTPQLLSAARLLSAAQARFPNDFWLNFLLATTLGEAERWDEALGYFRVALALRPEAGAVHNNFGVVLRATGRLDEAIAHFQYALRLDPEDAYAHNNLGLIHFAKGRLDEAIAEYEHAIRLEPSLAMAHSNLGGALYAKGQADEAIARCEHALRLDPTLAMAHVNLGSAVWAKGRLDEGIAHYKHAVRLDPKFALAHNNLGRAVYVKGRLDEAIAHYQDALRLDPKLGLAHFNLSEALLRSGRFQEARAATQHWLDLLAEDDPQRASALRRLKDCERLLALEAKLPAFLEGKEQPADAAEQRELADLCQNYKRLYAAAARFYAAAFAAQPQLADDLQTQDRYNAACAAALAAAGQGADAAKLSNEERARLRRQALEWLTADLAAWEHRIKDNPQQEQARVQKTLRHWKADRDLAEIRDTEALAKLPGAEGEACRKLWTAVEALLPRAHQK